MIPHRQDTIHDAIQRLIPCTEIAPWSREFVEDLRLPKTEQDQVLFELQCLLILAVQFALTQALEEDGGMLEELLTAYHQYWLTYSEAVSVSYAEEVFQRLPLYREATFGEVPGGSLQVGKVFAELCGIAGANFTAFGTNVFASAYGAAVGVMESLDIERTD